MSDSLYDALHEFLEGSGDNATLDLVAASKDTDLSGLSVALDALGIDPDGTFVVRQAKLTQPTSDTVLLGGNVAYGTPGGPQSTADLSMNGSQPDGNLFVIAVTPRATDWTFGSFFPTLPPYQQAISGGLVQWQDTSFVTALQLDLATFTASSEDGTALKLSGQLQPAGVLADYAALFPTWPLSLDGAVRLAASTDDPPVLTLRATSPGTEIAFSDSAKLQNIGLAVSTEVELSTLVSSVPDAAFLELVGDLYFGDSTNPLTLSAALLASTTNWRFRAAAQPGDYRIGDQISAVADLLGLNAKQLLTPEGLDTFNSFYLSEVEFSVSALTSLDQPMQTALSIGVTLASDEVWNPPIPFVYVQDVGTRWLVGVSPTTTGLQPYISGTVYGGITIGDAPPPTDGPVEDPVDGEDLTAFTIDVNALVPEFVVTGTLRDGDEIPIGQAFSYFFGDPGPTTPDDMRVTAFAVRAMPLERTFYGSADITMNWSVELAPNVAITMTQLSLEIGVTQSSVNGAITGFFQLGGGADYDPDLPTLTIGAAYTSSGDASGWRFSALLIGRNPIPLSNLVVDLLGIAAPSGLPTLDLTAMDMWYDTGTSAYSASGAIKARWVVPIFGDTAKVSATASAAVSRPNAQTSPSGRLSGTFSVNSLALTVARDVGVDEPTYLFQIKYEDAWLQAVTAWTGEPDSRHQVVTVQLGGVTLGSVLETLVNLAAPTLGFHLDPPWDVLNSIDLSRFVLTIDPTDNVVSLTYALALDLVVMQIDQIGVRYDRSSGSGSVGLILEGNFLGTDYSGDDALSWDVVNNPPPAVPGMDAGLTELRYLGVGQHVTFADTSGLDSVKKTLDLLREQMRPVQNTDANPLDYSDLVFSAESQWLLGFDVGLMGTVDLGVIFNDPVLYGLYIQLSGEKAGSMAGLYFEVLYKKITDDIGMFRVELRLPEAFRHIELGEVSITLGVIVVEVYTNGNFMIDLGFPYDRDFDRSFSVEVFPFLGRGGVYFGLLDGNTSSRVPTITNGAFSPVLELGVGLAVGVGKDITVGPMSGGIYVQVEVLFQGVLGWFNPTSNGTAAAKYYWVQGIAAIHGKLYGTVDFKVIKVSVTVEAYAEASVLLEAYRAAVFRLAVGVTVEAKVKVLFVKVSFSFDTELDVSFEVGRDSTPPWTVGSSSGGSVGAFSAARRKRALRAVPHRSTAVRTTESAGELDWDASINVFQSEEPVQVPIFALPVFSASGIPVSWDGEEPAQAGTYQVALCLFADNGMAGTGATVAEARLRDTTRTVHADGLNELPAAVLAEAFLRWSFYAVTGSTTGTLRADQMEALSAGMNTADTADGGFSLTNLETFFTNNLELQISGDPGGDPTDVGGMLMAVPPPLTMAWSGTVTGSVDFSSFTKVGGAYERGVAAYMEGFAPVVDGVSGDGSEDGGDESFASFVFRDWCLLIAKTAVQAASDAMTAWEIDVEDATTLSDLCDSFHPVDVQYAVRSGDTVASVADALGATVAELDWFDEDLSETLASTTVGAKIAVTLGVCPEKLALDNATRTLAEGTYTLGTLETQILAGDSFDTLAGRFDLTVEELFDQTTLSNDPQVLAAGSPFTTSAFTWSTPASFDALSTAATFYARFALPDLEGAHWYAQTIAQWNADALEGVGLDGIIATGTPLELPSAPDAQPSGTATYTSLPGDTVHHIAAALELAQAYSTGDGGPPGWSSFRDAVTVSEQEATVPASASFVEPGDTVQSVALRMLVWGDDPATGVAGLLGWIGGQEILDELGVVALPDLQVDTTTHPSFQAIASAFGIDLGEVGTRLATAEGLLPAGTYVATHLDAVSMDLLVTQVLEGTLMADLSGMASRFMLAGLRLPAPEDDGDAIVATGPLTSILSLSGQMFAGPDPQGATLDITLTNPTPASWITFVDSETLGGDPNDIVARFPHAARLNRALLTTDAVLDGTIVQTDTLDALTLSFDDLGALYPDRALTVPVSGPEAMAPTVEVPRTYGLDHRVALQSPVALAIPQSSSNVDGTASMWPFSTDLMALAASEPTALWEIVKSADRRTSGDEDTVLNSTFGCSVQIVVRRVDALEGIYELVGSTTTAAQTLLTLWQNLPGDADAYLLVPPAADAGNPEGLAVLDTSSAQTFVLKSNLSTATVPGLPQSSVGGIEERSEDGETTWFADLTELSAFLTLVWEGCVVGGAGFSLGVRTNDGAPLPSSMFDDQGNGTLTLLVVAPDSTAPAPQGRAMPPYANCVLVAAGLDPAAQSLWIEAADDSDLTAVGVLPAGNVGFELTMPKPTGDETSQKADIADLYSLLTAQLGSDGDVFYAADQTPPLTPSVIEAGGVPSWKKRRMQRRARARAETLQAGDAVWKYQQVLPVYRFGPPSVLPAVPGLPDPDADPYRGVQGTTLPQANVQASFVDLLGNTSLDPASVPLDAGYTDVLAPVGSWPATVASYALGGSSAAPSMTVTIAIQAGAGGVDLSKLPESAIATAAATAATYASVVYQLAQDDVTAQLRTPLSVDDAGAPAPVSIPFGRLAAWRYCAAAYAFASASAALESVSPFASSSGPLSVLADDYGVGLDATATANLDRDTEEMFGSIQLPLDATVVFVENATATSIVSAVPDGWPQPTAQQLLSSPANANVLPLRVGAVLNIPSTPVPTTEDSTFATLAASASTSMALLAEDNADTSGLFTPSAPFVVDGVTVSITSEDYKLSDVVDAFVAEGVNVTSQDVAVANADVTGLFVGGAVLSTTSYIVPQPTEADPVETLQSNGSGASVESLAELNTATPNLFDAGALIDLGAFDPAPQASGTLRELADRYGTTPALVLQSLQNAGFSLPEGSILVVPGMLAAQPEADGRVPYTARSTDTLSALVQRFAYATGDAGLTQATTDNAEMPGTLVAGQTITVATAGIETSTGETLAQALAGLQEQDPSITMAQLAASIAEQTGLLASEALWLCPLPRLPNSASSITTLVDRYGVDATAFGQANQGLPIIADSVTLTLQADGVQGTVETVAHDTLNAIAARFQSQGVQASVGDILAANPDALLFSASATALLPPTAREFTVPLQTTLPATAPAVFPLSAELQFRRSTALADPDLDPDNPVLLASTAIPSPVSPQLQGAAGIDLETFAANLADIFPDLRLATGTMSTDPSELWAVSFGSAGVAQLTVAPAVPNGEGDLWPRYLALRPLYPSVCNRSVVLEEVQADGSLQQAEHSSDLTVDSESLARTFLADVDRFLSVPTVTGVYADAPLVLGRALDAKKTLLTAVSGALGAVLQLDDPDVDEGIAAARKVLESALGTSLSAAYATEVVVQYDSTVQSAWTSGSLLPARMDGLAVPAGQPDVDGGLGYSLSNAKTPLAQTSGFVTFLMAVDDASHNTDVAVDLDYTLAHLELHIQDVVVDPDTTYQASDWLTFVPSMTPENAPSAVQTALGAALVPVPLRAYPDAPVLDEEAARRSDDAPTLDTAADWSHKVTYVHEHAAQDEALLTTTYNLQASVGEFRRKTAGADLASQLAIYDGARQALWDLLQAYTDPSANHSAAATAADSLVTLIEGVTDAWSQHWGTADPVFRFAAPALQRFEFQISLTYDAGTIASVDIVSLQNEPGPTGEWPDVTYRSPTGLTVQLGSGSTEGGIRVYRFYDPPPEEAWASIELGWAGLNTASFQNARSALSVLRNRMLFEPDQPQIPTASDFVFRSPQVQAPSVTTPLNQVPVAYDISGLGATLAEALQAALDALFDGNWLGKRVTMQLSYGYALVPGNTTLVTALPIGLYPSQTLSADTPGDVQAYMDAWFAAQSPVTEGGNWEIRLTQLSELTADRRAVLEVGPLRYALTDSS